MTRRHGLTALIVYIAISLGLLTATVAQLNVGVPWAHPYTLTLHFADAAGILPNNEVYMNGVKVGYVRDVSVSDGQAVTTVVITEPDALPVYSDATAQVRKKNLLGETYIDLQRGSNTCSSCTLASGASLAIDHTVPITEIDQVLAIFDPTTVARVQLIINALGDATNANGANMNASAGSTDTLVSALNDPAVVLATRRQQIADIIDELQQLYAVLAAQRQQIASALTTWNDVMAQLAAQDGSIGATVVQADTLVSSLDTLLRNEGPNLQATLSELPAALTATQTFLDQTGGILNAIAPYRADIHDVFPHLASSFADTDANGQHFWSVYSVSCASGCGGNSPTASDTTSPSFWAVEGAQG